MRLRALPIAWIVAAVLAGCAGSPETFRSDTLLGHVTAREEKEGGAGSAVIFPVPIGTVLLPLSFTAPGTAARHFLYTIRDANGHKFYARSWRLFDVGDCAKLWFSAPVDSPPAEGSILAGSLEKSRECR